MSSERLKNFRNHKQHMNIVYFMYTVCVLLARFIVRFRAVEASEVNAGGLTLGRPLHFEGKTFVLNKFQDHPSLSNITQFYSI